MIEVFKQPLEKRKRFTVVGVKDGGPCINHVAALDSDAAESVAKDQQGGDYVCLAVFKGYHEGL